MDIEWQAKEESRKNVNSEGFNWKKFYTFHNKTGEVDKEFKIDDATL